MNDVAAGAHTIRKRFGATTALDGVDFEVLTGEIHALVGENGAGKSTLVRILGGAVRPDEGWVTIGGWECRLTSPHDAIVNGVTTIPQELHLVPSLSIAENLALGRGGNDRLGRWSRSGVSRCGGCYPRSEPFGPRAAEPSLGGWRLDGHDARALAAVVDRIADLERHGAWCASQSRRRRT